jgi:hypothetical protein
MYVQKRRGLKSQNSKKADGQNTQAEVMQTKAKQRKKINTTKQTQTQRAKKPLIFQHKHQKSADESTQS